MAGELDSQAVKRGSARGSRIGEAVGECAAVCCCCPCAGAHLLLLAVYRVPRLLWTKRKEKRMIRVLADRRRTNPATECEEEKIWVEMVGEKENDIVGWNSEVWDRFDWSGFWRSSSERMSSAAGE